MISNRTMVIMEVLCPMEVGEEPCSDYDCCSSQPKGLCLSNAVEARVNSDLLTIPPYYISRWCHGLFYVLGENNFCLKSRIEIFLSNCKLQQIFYNVYKQN